MSCGWPRASAVLLLAALPPAVAAQGREAGATAFLTTARTTTAGTLLHLGLRPGGSAPRLALGLGAGGAGGEVVGRAELVAHLLLPHDPGAAVAFYAGGGVAAVTGPERTGWLVVLAGMETNPGGRAGVALEAGVGGGLRLAAGWRRRW